MILIGYLFFLSFQSEPTNKTEYINQTVIQNITNENTIENKFDESHLLTEINSLNNSFVLLEERMNNIILEVKELEPKEKPIAVNLGAVGAKLQ